MKKSLLPIFIVASIFSFDCFGAEFFSHHAWKVVSQNHDGSPITIGSSNRSLGCSPLSSIEGRDEKTPVSDDAKEVNKKTDLGVCGSCPFCSSKIDSFNEFYSCSGNHAIDNDSGDVVVACHIECLKESPFFSTSTLPNGKFIFVCSSCGSEIIKLVGICLNESCQRPVPESERLFHCENERCGHQFNPYHIAHEACLKGAGLAYQAHNQGPHKCKNCNEELKAV
jgi:hypothetical protein